MPGTVTSMPNSGLPVTIFALSTPGIGWPMILKRLRILERHVGEIGHRQRRGLCRESAIGEPRPLSR